MPNHHLILGSLTDFLTGRQITDTHDERYRQKIIRYLVENKGFPKKSIESARSHKVTVGKRSGILLVDFLLQSGGFCGMMIKYGPGSLVTRYNPAVAISRLLFSYQIPLVVVTNGEDAHLLDGNTGGLISEGFDSLPGLYEFSMSMKKRKKIYISESKRGKAERIAFAYEIIGACNCGDEVFECHR